LSAVMARRPAVGGLRDHRHAVGDAWDVELLAGPLDKRFMHARRRTGLEDPVRRAADVLLAAGDSDEGFGLVVIRRDVLVSDGPIGAEAVASVRMKVVVGEAEREPPIVIRTAAEDARAKPFEGVALGYGVGLAFKVPPAVRHGEESECLAFAEVGLAALFSAAVRVIVRSLVFFEIARRVQHGTGFQKSDVHAEVRQDFDHGATTGTGTDDDDVVDRAATNDLHDRQLSIRRYPREYKIRSTQARKA